jgi:hypothetical protein
MRSHLRRLKQRDIGGKFNIRPAFGTARPSRSFPPSIFEMEEKTPCPSPSHEERGSHRGTRSCGKTNKDPISKGRGISVFSMTVSSRLKRREKMVSGSC